MSISIITPHYNDFKGLQDIYACLLKQTQSQFEWIVVDDCSDDSVGYILRSWFDNLNDDRVQVIFNPVKGNASVCRNRGAEVSKNENLVFLDSDDHISNDFVENRKIAFEDFVVLQNIALLDEYNKIKTMPKRGENYLDHFLQARFIWQTTSILWKKDFFFLIGQFHPSLPRLQDIELVIRALQKSEKFKVIDNPVDFYYRVKPIRERKNFVEPVCKAVFLFISELLDDKTLSQKQKGFLKSYYFLCIRYFEKSGLFQDTNLVRRNLILFYKKGYISLFELLIGKLALALYFRRLINGSQFLRINRYLFKSQRT